MIRLHLAPAFGKVPLSQLNPQQVQAFLNNKSASDRSPRTVAYCRVVLRAALNQAIAWGVVGRNAAALTEPPKAKRREFTPLTPDQAKVFLAWVRAHRLYALMREAAVRMNDLLSGDG